MTLAGQTVAIATLSASQIRPIAKTLELPLDTGLCDLIRSRQKLPVNGVTDFPFRLDFYDSAQVRD